MSTITSNYVEQTSRETLSPIERASSILHWTYGLVPIAAGADKFTHILVNWDQYLAPAVSNILPIQPHTFMSIVGLIEIIAGVLVLVKPRTGSLIVAGWLGAIAINLLMTGKYFDVAVRDLVMGIGAYCFHLMLQGKEEKS